MILKLIENQNIKTTKITVECKEKDEQVKKIIELVEHLDKDKNILIACLEGKLFNLEINDIFYIESVERKTFGYTADNVYELGYKLYEIEEKYNAFDYMRISKSCIVNKNKIMIDHKSNLIKKKEIKFMFSNHGIQFFTALTTIIMLLK